MLEDLTSKELDEWYAYDRLEPIDVEYRDDLRMGILASTIVNFFSSVFAKKGSTPEKRTPEDFIPKFDESHVQAYEEYIQEELDDKILNWVKLHNMEYEKING